MKHWIVKNTARGAAPFLLYDEGDATGYAAVKARWQVDGPFVHAAQLAGAIDALRDIQDVAFEGNGAPADTQRLATVRTLATEALYRLAPPSQDSDPMKETP